jgi:hypothetical protein
MSAAEKLLARMRRSPAGWGQDDLDRLYKGFGFEVSGAGHNVYIHPKYPTLRATVARHNQLATGYATHAVKTIDRLKELQALENQGDKNENTSKT